VSILRALQGRTRHVVRLHAVYEDDTAVQIVMECVPLATLCACMHMLLRTLTLLRAPPACVTLRVAQAVHGRRAV
jgi:hypothetical protein